MGFLETMRRATNTTEQDYLQSKQSATIQYTPKENNFCQEADKFIKELDVLLAQYRKDDISGDIKKKLYARMMIKVLEPIRHQLEIDFVRRSCAMELENKKVKETAEIFTNETKKYEDDVLNPSNKQTKTLLLIGGAVLLVATGIILKFQKK